MRNGKLVGVRGKVLHGAVTRRRESEVSEKPSDFDMGEGDGSTGSSLFGERGRSE